MSDMTTNVTDVDADAEARTTGSTIPGHGPVVDENTLAAVGRMTAFIDAHLREPITAHQLAQAAGYSPYHAARLFAQVTGRTPFAYLRERRMWASAEALRCGEAGIRVIDVAFDFAFDSHEGFTRAFTRSFGVAPRRVAAVPSSSEWLLLYRAERRITHHRKDDTMTTTTGTSTTAAVTTPETGAPGTAIIFTQIVERPARRLLLRRASENATGYFSYASEVGCVDGGETLTPSPVLNSVREALYEPAGLWLPSAMRTPGTGTYALGVEVPADWTGTIPDGFDLIDLPPCSMLVFQGEPYDDADFESAIGALWERIASFNPVVYGYEWDDDAAPRMQLEPLGWRGYIEMRPIRKLA